MKRAITMIILISLICINSFSQVSFFNIGASEFHSLYEETGHEAANVIEEINVENWMTNLDEWNVAFNSEYLADLLVVGSEDEYAIEDWMLDNFQTNNVFNEKVTEEESEVEAWMLDLGSWN